MKASERIYLTFKAWLVACVLFSAAYGQDGGDKCSKSQNKKAVKLLEDAKHQARSGASFVTIKATVDKVLEEDADYVDAYLFLGDIAFAKQKWKDMAANYTKVAMECPDKDARSWYYLGKYHYDNQHYDDAAKYLKGFLKFEKKQNAPDTSLDKMFTDAEGIVSSAEFFANAKKNPVPFDPKPIPNVCTNDDEYLPLLSPDNDFLYYIRKSKKQKLGDIMATDVEEFTISKKQGDGFDKGDAMPRPFNAYNNQGAATISIDNKHMILTICKPEKHRVGGVMQTNINCDLYYTDFDNGKWSDITNLGSTVNDSIQWDSQPTMSPDGNTLYFSSARNEATGLDIYKSVKGTNGKWGKPVALGANINTRGNEKSPFLHPDGKTLYFSSDGWPGMGGFDIFYSKMDDNGKWGPARNIGFPINSENDDLGFFVSTDGKTGYFASNKLKGKGGYDIYYFPLYEGAQPEKVLFLKGDLKDEGTDGAVNAKIELKDVVTKQVYNVPVDTVTGKYAGVVNFKHDVIMTVKKKDYGFTSTYITKDDPIYDKPATVDVSIKEVEVGKQFKLNDINYATNSADMTENSKLVIDEFVEYLKENPDLKIEIRGHTDNVGSTAGNMALSTDRAFTVRQYIQEKGIDGGRLSHKGYGSSMPVAGNDSDEGRARNRRTEFVIIAR
ncbi:MAG: OmpA family protein [Bacteroidota bacterium]